MKLMDKIQQRMYLWKYEGYIECVQNRSSVVNVHGHAMRPKQLLPDAFSCQHGVTSCRTLWWKLITWHDLSSTLCGISCCRLSLIIGDWQRCKTAPTWQLGLDKKHFWLMKMLCEELVITRNYENQVQLVNLGILGKNIVSVKVLATLFLWNFFFFLLCGDFFAHILDQLVGLRTVFSMCGCKL